MKRLIILLCMLLAFSIMALGADTIGYTGSIYINDTSLTVNATFLRDGQSETLNVTMVVASKGNWILGAMVNSTSNTTAVNSSRVNITVYGGTHIMPICMDRVPSDPMCNNHTQYNATFLRDGETELYTVDVLIDGNIPMPSNWTLSAFVNMTANGTEVNSNSVIIEVTSEISIPLSVTINNPLNITYTNATILFDIDSTGNELRDCWYNLGNGSSDVSYTCNSTFQLNMGENAYHFTAYANQTNGSEAFDTIDFTIDKFPVWHDNTTSVASGLMYNPQQSYSFSINYTDGFSGIQNITISFNGTNTTFSFTDNRLEANATHYISTLGAGNYTYYWQGCDKNNCNFSDIYTFEIRKHSTLAYAYIDSLRQNKTYTYSPSEHTILANWTTNLTALLYLEGVSIDNGTDRVFGVGLFNISVINEGNNNYTDSSETWWVRVSQASTSTQLWLDNLEENLTISYNPININLTAYKTNGTLRLLIEGVNSTNPSIRMFGAGLYNITAVTLNETNYSSSTVTRWIRVSQHPTVTYLYIDNATGNVTKVYGHNTNISAYNTNATLELYINSSTSLNNSANGFIGILGAGFYNITAYSLNNTNYSGSSAYLWLNITQKNTSIMMTADGTRGDKSAMAEDIVNFTITLIDENSTVLGFNVGWYNNFSSAWVKHQTSASPLYNLTNLSGFSTGFYLFGGSFGGNTNYTGSGENWTLRVIDFNLTYSFSCNFSNFTYSNPSPAWFYNYTINFTNGSGSLLPLIDFPMVEIDTVRITNATGGERLSSSNYSYSGRTITARDRSSYLWKNVNVTARYYYQVLTNNSQKAVQPRWQNNSCGIFNLTLQTVGTTTDNGTLKVKISNPNNFSMQNITVKIGVTGNYSQAYNISNSSYTTLFNMTRGLSNMTWHWIDLNESKLGATLYHILDFHMFTLGS